MYINWDLFVIVLLLSVLGVMLFIHFRAGLYERREKGYLDLVANTSARYQQLLRINERYAFSELEENYDMNKSVNSKQQYDRSSPMDVLLLYVREKESYWRDILQKLETNKQSYKRYLAELECLPDYTIDTAGFDERKISLVRYCEIEKELCESGILKPVIHPTFDCVVSYSSPQGISQHSKHHLFSENELREALMNSTEQDLSADAYYQRQLMTPSLRYDIMRRDQFRCAICGRSAAEGVKLHVDHIIPVSKGGKTIPSNLRTLCADCNLGKSDKYDADGLN